MDSTLNLSQRIQQIIDNRKSLLPDIAKQVEVANNKLSSLQVLADSVNELINYEKDDELKADLQFEYEDISSLIARLKAQLDEFASLEGRFSRDTVNIGVSGEARQGKSTTLQSFSGLTETQIPTGEGLPVTAVRSEIFNSDSNYATITFRTQNSFINEYIKPHLEAVNELLDEKISIEGISDLRRVQLPDNLGNNVDSTTSNSLRSLQDAQESLETYGAYLTGETKTIQLDELRRFVAYPDNDEINAGNAERAYLAVDEVKIYCKLPSVGEAKIGLVDLPGLGEISNSVAKMHTSGLEDGIDQVVLIMKPSKEEGYAKAGISKNVDQLREIQKGIKRRSDLITAAINITAGAEKSAESLADDFERRINSAQESDKIRVEKYRAINPDSVRELFTKVLEKIAQALPRMDREVYEYVMDCNGINRDVPSSLSSLIRTVNKIRKAIPLKDKVIEEQKQKISKRLISEYSGNIEPMMWKSIGTKSEAFKSFEKMVASIHAANESMINSGFFKKSVKEWQDDSKGMPNYNSYFSEECHRVKAEIVSRYSEVDAYYSSQIEDLKARVLEAFFSNTGDLQSAIFDASSNPDNNEKIELLVNELDSTVREDDFTSAFKFIANVSFEFSQNVYSNIYQCIDRLQRQVAVDVDPKTGQKREVSLIPLSLNDNTIEEKSKIGTVQNKLRELAAEANSAIKDEILQYDDKFNEFLAICMSFFNDFLFRKDVDRFRYCIRSLITEYREFLVPPKAQDTDERKEKLIKTIKENIIAIDGKSVSQEIGFTAPKKPLAIRYQTDVVGVECSTAGREELIGEVQTQLQTRAADVAVPISPGSGELTAVPAKPIGANPPTPKKPSQKNEPGYSSNYDQEW